MAIASDIKRYELLVMYSPELGQEKFTHALDELRELFKKETKGLVHEDIWGMKSFAYKVKRFLSGYYVVFYFDAEPSYIAELKTHLRLHLGVLRYILLNLPDKFDLPLQHQAEERLLKFLFDRAPKAESMSRIKFKKKEMKKIEKKEEAPLQKKEPLLAGETGEEKLKAVEKTLESILENPDIEV